LINATDARAFSYAVLAEVDGSGGGLPSARSSAPRGAGNRCGYRVRPASGLTRSSPCCAARASNVDAATRLYATMLANNIDLYRDMLPGDNPAQTSILDDSVEPSAR
jgi:hypothetical protein